MSPADMRKEAARLEEQATKLLRSACRWWRREKTKVRLLNEVLALDAQRNRLLAQARAIEDAARQRRQPRGPGWQPMPVGGGLTAIYAAQAMKQVVEYDAGESGKRSLAEGEAQKREMSEWEHERLLEYYRSRGYSGDALKFFVPDDDVAKVDALRGQVERFVAESNTEGVVVSVDDTSAAKLRGQDPDVVETLTQLVETLRKD